MKKILFTILAALCLAACVEENIDTNQQLQEITFDTDFTAYVTKSGEVTQENITKFYVYGFRTKDLNGEGEGEPETIFGDTFGTGTEVTKQQDGSWKIDKNHKTQYWFPGYTYQFWAIAPQFSDMTSDFKPQTVGGSLDGMPEYFILST